MKVSSYYRAAPTKVGLIGVGSNVCQRVGKALQEADGCLRVIAYDIRPPNQPVAFPVEVVADNFDLARRLQKEKHEVVFIETPCRTHPELIRLAARAGVPVIHCEKMLATTVGEVEDLIAFCQGFGSPFLASIIDHYLLFELADKLRVLAGRLGTITSLKVILHETKRIAPAEEKSHEDGMVNFIHHACAMACAFFDPADLIAVEAYWARHNDARVPNTFLSARFASRHNGRVVFEASVGKYMPRARRQIVLEGTRGWACLDRDASEIRLVEYGAAPEVYRGDAGDNGYRALVRAVADRRVPATLLTPEQALAVLRLVLDAQAIARLASVYERVPVPDVVCDWEIR